MFLMNHSNNDKHTCKKSEGVEGIEGKYGIISLGFKSGFAWWLYKRLAQLYCPFKVNKYKSILSVKV